MKTEEIDKDIKYYRELSRLTYDWTKSNAEHFKQIYQTYSQDKKNAITSLSNKKVRKFQKKHITKIKEFNKVQNIY